MPPYPSESDERSKGILSSFRIWNIVRLVLQKSALRVLFYLIPFFQE